MTAAREFLSDFIKLRRTPVLWLYLLPPLAAAPLFLAYYAHGGCRLIPDARAFFLLLCICLPAFSGIAVPAALSPDLGDGKTAKLLGFPGSRAGIYLGKLYFLLFLSAAAVVLYIVCFSAAAGYFAGAKVQRLPHAEVFCILLCQNLFLCLLHLPVTLRFGASVSVLTGFSGTIVAGLFENPIGDGVWMLLPWEWGVRLLKSCLGYSDAPALSGILLIILIMLSALALSLLWFCRWEGRAPQE